jgi:serine/threonine protein kinase
MGDGTKDAATELASRWCQARGPQWSVIGQLGRGGTAAVFEIASPEGSLALKLYDANFSSGDAGRAEQQRIDQILALKGHDCQFLTQIYEGGRFEDRLYLLMSKAPGRELAERLRDVPRAKIRLILHQVTRAAIFLASRSLCHRDIKAENIFVSDDFSHCTLLDLSVVRDLCDPVGVGTDHDGQLPIVATARYSPPEYLFRLVDPGSELWHALTVYQLGALLHDLIAGEEMFEAEYQSATSNRYRFAWIIATHTPPLVADGVDHDLILLARRALDKNWQRRSILRLEDFLETPDARTSRALQALGLSPTVDSATSQNRTAMLRRLAEMERMLDMEIPRYIRSKGITALHERLAGSRADSRQVRISWSSPSDASVITSSAVLSIHLGLAESSAGDVFTVSVTLEAVIDGVPQSAALDLPDENDRPDLESSLCGTIIATFERLATVIFSTEEI